MKFDGRGGISIVELIFYVPSLVLAVILCFRHGFGRSSGWISLVILSGFRIAGACCQLATYSKSSTGLFIATAVLNSLGLVTLLFATLGLLSRVVDAINRNINGPLQAAHFRIIQILIVVALIVTIVGDSSISNHSGNFSVPTTAKAGIILIAVAYVAICLVTFRTLADLSHAESSERRLAFAVVVALPFILVRLVYSLLTVFLKNPDFNIVTGSAAILGTMATLEEIIVVADYLIVGFLTPALPAGQRGPIMTRGNKAPIERGSSRMPVRRGRRGGLIITLIGRGIDTIRQSQQTQESERQNIPMV